MASRQVVKAQKISKINIPDIVVSPKKAGKIVPITYKNKSLVFQTPFFEVKGNLRSTDYPNIYQVDTLFKGDTKQKNNECYQFIENTETHIIEQVRQNGSEWFTQKDVIIKPLLRDLDTEKGNYIKWPIDLTNNIFVDEHRQPFEPTKLRDKDLIKLIVEIPHLWVHENQFGLVVVVQKVLV